MRMSYAREKMGVAVVDLATGKGTIQDRLWKAYLGFHPVSEDDFPDGLAEDYLEIMSILTREEPSYDTRGEVTTGSVQNTLAKMTADEASDVAQMIVNINYKLHRSD